MVLLANRLPFQVSWQHAASYIHYNTNTLSRAQRGKHELFRSATAITEYSSNSLSHSKIYRQEDPWVGICGYGRAETQCMALA